MRGGFIRVGARSGSGKSGTGNTITDDTISSVLELSIQPPRTPLAARQGLPEGEQGSRYQALDHAADDERGHYPQPAGGFWWSSSQQRASLSERVGCRVFVAVSADNAP